MTVKQLERRVEFLEQVLGYGNKHVVTINDIAKVVCSVYRVTMLELRSESRIKRLVEPRKMFCFLSKYYRSSTCIETAKILNRDHTSVLWGIKAVKNLLETDDTFTVEKFKKCKKKLEGDDKNIEFNLFQ